MTNEQAPFHKIVVFNKDDTERVFGPTKGKHVILLTLDEKPGGMARIDFTIGCSAQAAGAMIHHLLRENPEFAQELGSAALTDLMMRLTEGGPPHGPLQ